MSALLKQQSPSDQICTKNIDKPVGNSVNILSQKNPRERKIIRFKVTFLPNGKKMLTYTEVILTKR